MRGEIKVECFLRDGETLVPTEDLSPAQREKLACWLKETYLNELCRGRAVFVSAIEQNKTAIRLHDTHKKTVPPYG